MIDDYIINYIINEAKKLAAPQNEVLQKRQCNLYLSTGRLERLRRLLNEKMPGETLSSFIDRLIDIALKALEDAPYPSEDSQQVKPAQKCFIHTCKLAAVKFAVDKATGKRYPVCERHLNEIKDHPSWILDDGGIDEP